MNTLAFFVFISVSLLVIGVSIIENFSKMSVRRTLLSLVAIIIGLIMGALLSAPVSKLPGLYGEILPIVVSFVSVLFSLILLNKLLPQIDKWLDSLRKVAHFDFLHLSQRHEESLKESVLDTSVLIDKRVVAITRSGFFAQKIILPRFVLAELQNIADSKDGDRRDKGRRGLEAVEELKKMKRGELEVVADDFPQIAEVDHKLVALAKKRHASLVTTDYNLNKVASVENVRVLNINELAQGLRPDLLPGEQIEVKVVHLGKDKTQGVGYMEDGTMIVVEGGSKLVGKSVSVKISRSLQTAAGKMFFAKVSHE